MPQPRLLRGGGHVARVRPWPSEPSTAQLVTLDLQQPPPAAVLRSWLNELRSNGFQRVRTGAVSELRTGPFDALGFAVVQRLTLLHLDLLDERVPVSIDGTVPAAATGVPAEVHLRKARTGELPVLAAIDASAFPVGWSLDTLAIEDAAGATQRSRIRVATDSGRTAVGYAVSGRSGRSAFLQRLAVSPDAQGSGIGALLVEDSIAWARRWRCRSVAVNTQDDNDRARRLYERAGFIARSHGLLVLERTLATEA